jgi:hypothetical protein
VHERLIDNEVVAATPGTAVGREPIEVERHHPSRSDGGFTRDEVREPIFCQNLFDFTGVCLGALLRIVGTSKNNQEVIAIFMALSGENADLVMMLRKNGSALPPLAMSPLCTAPFLHMTIVCIDILEEF